MLDLLLLWLKWWLLFITQTISLLELKEKNRKSSTKHRNTHGLPKRQNEKHRRQEMWTQSVKHWSILHWSKCVSSYILLWFVCNSYLAVVQAKIPSIQWLLFTTIHENISSIIWWKAEFRESSISILIQLCDQCSSQRSETHMLWKAKKKHKKKIEMK